VDGLSLVERELSSVSSWSPRIAQRMSSVHGMAVTRKHDAPLLKLLYFHLRAAYGRRGCFVAWWDWLQRVVLLLSVGLFAVHVILHLREVARQVGFLPCMPLLHPKGFTVCHLSRPWSMLLGSRTPCWEDLVLWSVWKVEMK
jgi:hypothetical protein